MARLPVIVGFGGINPAGRTSSHQAYRRIVFDLLPKPIQQEVLLDLANLTNTAYFHHGHWYKGDTQLATPEELVEQISEEVLAQTLIRRIHPSLFDVDNVSINKSTSLLPSGAEESIQFTIKTRSLPDNLPEQWQVTKLSETLSEVVVKGNLEAFVKDTKSLSVKAAGQLPTGFDPAKLYQSRNHPRGLQMTVYGASDALSSSGIPWQSIKDIVPPDQVAVYAANSIGQMDDLGFGGMLKSALMGKRTTSKHLPLGYAQMPADFVNAYVLGSVGSIGTSIGACATYFFNLEKAVEGIKSGKTRVAVVGGSDAPITPEIIEGFRTMGALAEDSALLALDAIKDQKEPDHTQSCRPFGNNAGFTIGESSQWTLIMDDALAIELGAQIFGSVPAVYAYADGHKKSISAPGIGNYLTMGKAMGYLKKIIGEDGLKNHTFIQAHGTSTPQNRITESHVLSQAATSFNAKNIPVTAMKAFIGHSQGTAGGDQLHLSLGVWEHGILPGFTTTKSIADDVYTDGLKFQLKHEVYGKEHFKGALLNSKGFGGNNGTAVLLSPAQTLKMLTKRYDEETMRSYHDKLAKTQEAARDYNQAAIHGESKPIYHFGKGVLTGYDLEIDSNKIKMPGYLKAVDLDVDNEFSDLTD